MSGSPCVGVLFGGRSVEHEVSVVSARGVARALGGTDLSWFPIAVTGEGRWLTPETSRAVLDGDGDRAEPAAGEDDGGRLLVDPGGGGLIRLSRDGSSGPVELDVVFPLVHGWGGEDGRVQGALDLAGIPCVGAGVLGSAVAMDKAVAKDVFRSHGLPVVPWVTLRRDAHARDPQATRVAVASQISFPVFVKPANGGSSVGVSRVDSAEKLDAALDEAFDCDGRVLVEQALDAREIECAVLGNEDPQPSVLGEIVPSGEFYDYAAKYLDGTSELRIPAELPGPEAEAIRRNAVEAFVCLELQGFARVDFLVERNRGRAYLNEVNTLPGFTPISMFPKLWEATGLAYGDLIERLVRLALERWHNESTRRTFLGEGG